MASDDKDRQGLSKLQYRNLVVALYLNAMDAQYASFRTRLSRQRKGGSLALGLTSLGLTTAVPLVATGVKDALSALATGATGTRAALDKELYFDQALPALLAAMEAERANTKAEILQHLKQTVDNYPLDLAFAELNQYQMSATFERAIDKITADANADRTVALRKVGAASIAPASKADRTALEAAMACWREHRADYRAAAVSALASSEPGIVTALGNDDEQAVRENLSLEAVGSSASALAALTQQVCKTGG
ncbi:MAG: hypothetical protein ABR588_07550 [Sphingomicrobium sp.]